MSCQKQPNCCNCNFNIKCFGTADLARIRIDGEDRTELNWNEISVPEILTVPIQKPDIESIDQVHVDVQLNCVKLIETPFAYKVYDRLATAYEITAATDAINLAVVDITPIVDAVNAILAIPGLPVIPEVAELQVALDAVIAADANLTTAITNALAVLAGTCVSASAILSALQSVSAAIVVLQTALNLLLAAANALATATAGIPIVGPAVAAAVAVLAAAIDAVVVLLVTALQSIAGAITLIGDTSYFAIIPNEEGTCLSGRKIIVEGVLTQKVVYTGLVNTQSVHSACFKVPFSTYIIPYAKFVGLEYEENVEVILDPDTVPCTTTTINGFAFNPNDPINVDLCEEFCVDAYIEDIFAHMLDVRTIFKNVTLFLQAKPSTVCD
ncbi:UNVERIFIED_CONTAM: uncharacterized protein DUF3794 [Acetivibrio alkalicellulosi]